MRKAAMLLAVIGLGLPILSSLPAQALLVDRTWVSGSGTDAGVCLQTTPCATFQFAHDNTTPGGEINCINAGS